jgi:hypothetical protein
MGIKQKTLSVLTAFLLLVGSIKAPIADLTEHSRNESYSFALTVFSAASNNFFCLPNKSQSFFNPNLNTGSYSEDKTHFLSSITEFLERKSSVGASKYLSYIKSFCPGLSIRDIIYPFHHFW